MITAAERRAKIEKLRREREAKEKEREERAVKQQEEQSMKTTSDQLITRILNQNIEAQDQLTSTASMPSAGQVQQNQAMSRLPLRVASHVVELEIIGIRPAEKYDKEIMCDIPDPKASRLGRIAEDEEFDNFQDDFNARFEATSLNRQGDSRQVARRGSLSGSQHIKAMQKENKLCPKCQEKKDIEDTKGDELTKPEVEAIIKTPDF